MTSRRSERPHTPGLPKHDAQRHANATSAEARLAREGNHLVLWVHDNGRGYDPQQAQGRRSLGLVGIRERALVLNGEFKIEGAAQKGTTVTVSIPLPRSD